MSTSRKGPKARFPTQFPRGADDVSVLDRSRSLLLGFLKSRISAADLLTSLASFALAKTANALSVLSSLHLLIIYGREAIPSFMRGFTTLFVALLTHDDESVRRSSLVLVASLTDHFAGWFAELAENADSWPSDAKQCFLSFAFAFKGQTAAKYAAFVPLASQWALSNDQRLAEVAGDFLSFMRPINRPAAPSIRKIGQKMPPPRSPRKKVSAVLSGVRDLGGQPIFAGADVERYLSEVVAPISLDLSGGGEEELSATQEFLVLEAAQDEEEDDETEEFFGGGPPIEETNYLKKLDYLAGQREGIRYFEKAVGRDPVMVAGQCRELWNKLGDLVLSDDAEIAEGALRLAGIVFGTFSQQLSPSGSGMIASCFNCLSSTNQGIAHEADNLLSIIAQKAPKSHVLQSFIAGARHKSAIARGKAVKCIGTVIRQGRLDDREFSALLKSLTPLLRDSKGEIKSSTRTVLGILATDQRFERLSATAITKSQDLRDLIELVE